MTFEPSTSNVAQRRLEALCDPGSLRVFRSGVASRRLGGRARAGDGVVTASGLVGGQPVLCYSQDGTYLGGSLGEMHAESIVKLLRLAGRTGAPVVGFIESGGARLQEGLAALAGYSRIFSEHVRLSGVVPQVSVICGASAGGGCYAPALTDFVVMTEQASMFLTGPDVVREITGEDVTMSALGGWRVHARTGVCHFTAASDAAAADLVRELLGHLPGGAPPAVAPGPAGFPPDAVVPSESRRVYDVRDVVRAIADGGRLLEWSRQWARNLMCAFTRIDGRAVGVVANQPAHLGGVLCAESASKGAAFVRTCDAFGLPLVVLVDTPGFLPGTKQEQRAVIRHGAKLVHAFAAASVPSCTVILRKAFGGAFIAMNSRDLGADYVFAWPEAQLGVMGAHQAVGIIHRREIAGADDAELSHAVLAERYAAEHLSAELAAVDGHVDEVIAPTETRDRLIAALSGFGRDQSQRFQGAEPDSQMSLSSTASL
ncbi:MAG TPA: carboxyl transferase domain-containing protein [Solirubrobacteraceae bacterium]|nr:carboxyl transferase domain-containing protein [Solirubrobacteraceae bacterium]